MRRNIFRRRLTSAWRSVAEQGHDSFRSLAAHPLRAAGIGVVCAVLLLLIATTTLPMALAPVFPDLARSLNPRDPVVLQRSAEAARARYFALDRPPSPQPPAVAAPAPAAATTPEGEAIVDSISRLPEAAPAPPADGGATAPEAEPEATEAKAVMSGGPPVIESAQSGTAQGPGAGADAAAQREEIRARAAALAAVDPLNPVPFRMQAEVAVDPDEHRRLMLEAAKRSRRDLETIVWLLQDDLDHDRYDAALIKFEMLLRTRPRMLGPIFATMGRLAEDPAGRPALVAWLARSPQWRQAFFQNLNRSITRADTPFQLMLELREAGQPPTEAEINQYLSFLLSQKFSDFAYNVWVQTRTPEALGHAGFLNNPSFETDPSGSPFDWAVAAPRNAVGEFIPLRELGGARVFHVSFGVGRVTFPQLSQTLVLPPGRYRLEGKLRGTIIGKRGLLWRIECLYRADPPLGETEQLLGQSQAWRLFGVEFEVPATPECAAQRLRLLHDARSASEELVSGEVWFDDLGIQRLQQATN